MSSAATPAAGGTFGLHRIRQISITVHDMERAIRFYRDTLGMTFLFQPQPGLAFFDCGGVRLMLSLPEGDGERIGTSVLYYLVDDIHQAHATLVARGVSFVDTPHMVARMPDHALWITICRDSEENFVGLMSEARA
jgi:methylmalonyl-CoA/ethylmalonyl-CoA epimerase